MAPAFADASPRAGQLDIEPEGAIAGHASATMTLDTYGHLMTDRTSEAADLYDPLNAPERARSGNRAVVMAVALPGGGPPWG